MRAQVATRPKARNTYRHGHLRRALLDAAIELARNGGADAVVLREVTRQAGVVPNAAYRHFASRQDLLQAVRSAALSAMAVAMETELARVRPGENSAEYARACLRAVGSGYLSFALKQEGLYRAAWAIPDASPGAADPARAGNNGLNPFQLLGAALDRLVEAGVLPAERRPGAEYLAWAAVRGFATLIIDGPLRQTSRRYKDGLAKRLLAMVENGL